MLIGGLYRRIQVSHRKLYTSRTFRLIAYPSQGAEMYSMPIHACIASRNASCSDTTPVSRALVTARRTSSIAPPLRHMQSVLRVHTSAPGDLAANSPTHHYDVAPSSDP